VESTDGCRYTAPEIPLAGYRRVLEATATTEGDVYGMAMAIFEAGSHCPARPYNQSHISFLGPGRGDTVLWM